MKFTSIFSRSAASSSSSASSQITVVDQLLPTSDYPVINLDSKVSCKGRLLDVRVIYNPDDNISLVEAASQGTAYISMRSPNSTGIKLMCGQHKLGHIALRNNRYSTPEIDDLENSSDSKGAGQALVELACRMAISNGHFCLDADSLEGSAAFYFKMGFRFSNNPPQNNSLYNKLIINPDYRSGLGGDMTLNLKAFEYGLAELNVMASLLSRYL